MNYKPPQKKFSFECIDIPIEQVPGKRTNPVHDILWAKMILAPAGVPQKFEVPRAWNSRNENEINGFHIYQFFKRREKELKCTVSRQGNYVLITKIST